MIRVEDNDDDDDDDDDDFCSGCQDYAHLDDHTYDITSGFKPFTVK